MKLFKVTSVVVVMILVGCTNKNNAPTIGFVDAFEDNTIAQAKTGFFDALKKQGFSEEQKTINVLYKNAQGSIPVVTQIIQYFKGKKVDLIASCPTISTTTALQNTSEIPVFMMVSPTPQLMQLMNKKKEAPKNLFGVCENQNYIDTSFSLITKVLPKKKLKIGLIFNQAEPQSKEAIERIRTIATTLQIELAILPVNSSAETLLVTQSLLTQNIDAFFAMPDNVVFSSFETIVNACNKAKVPVFTSESGLVARGAVAAFGADMYSWGYQTGEQVAIFLKTKSTKNISWELVKNRKRVFNAKSAANFNITMPKDFVAVDTK